MNQYIREFDKIISEDSNITRLFREIQLQKDNCYKQIDSKESYNSRISINNDISQKNNKDDSSLSDDKINCYEKIVSYENYVKSIKKKVILDGYEFCFNRRSNRNIKQITVGLYKHEYTDNVDYNKISECINEFNFNHYDKLSGLLSEKLRELI